MKWFFRIARTIAVMCFLVTVIASAKYENHRDRNAEEKQKEYRERKEHQKKKHEERDDAKHYHGIDGLGPGEGVNPPPSSGGGLEPQPTPEDKRQIP